MTTLSPTPTPAGEQPGAPRLAAIDIGTNSIRLVVAEALSDCSFRVIDDEKVLTRLGRGLSETNALSNSAMELSALTINHLKSIAEGRGASVLRAVATCAVREATNSDAFVKLVRERAGIDLDIISAEEEARLAFRSVANAFDLRPLSVATVDVGGGSTEVVLSSGEVIERVFPLALGCVRLTERFGIASRPVSDKRYRQLRKSIRLALKNVVGKPPFQAHLVIGTGGTFTSIASMSMHRGMPGSDGSPLPFAVRGYELQRSEVHHFLELLRKMSMRERARVPGLNPERADIIVAGLAIVDGVLDHFGVNRLRVHDEGIRAGLIYELIDDLTPPGGAAGNGHVDWERSVRQFSASCQHDQRHSEHVADLACQLFDALADEVDHGSDLWASEGSRKLLRAAALLHDVGYLISYDKHHKHTYHLIMHSGLSGFTHHELELVALIARYHRGAKPKSKHAAFARLPKTGQDLVRRLSAIVRMAVGLDRSHAQRIERVHVACCDGMAIFEVHADRDPSVELWGAERKSGLFKSAFRLQPRFRWASGNGQVIRSVDRRQ